MPVALTAIAPARMPWASRASFRAATPTRTQSFAFQTNGGKPGLFSRLTVIPSSANQTRLGAPGAEQSFTAVFTIPNGSAEPICYQKNAYYPRGWQF